MDIQRIDAYSDDRFSQTVLNQHGAYWIAGNPYEIEIVGRDTAIVRGADPAAFRELIETFRFHAPHITRYLDQRGERLAEYDRVELLTVGLDGIQPSQFFVDEEKLRAVKTFVHHADDIVIQVLPWEGRFVSLDGHTRLYLARNGAMTAFARWFPKQMIIYGLLCGKRKNAESHALDI
ncbi:MAG: hypothetical protein IJT76_08255 [Clostridia bacterium]|nr:hypothetical protein [Clostridia bacterium]